MIKIIIAETGSQYEYPMSKFVSSTSLKKAVNLLETIEKDHSIAKENQVILRQVDGRQLEEHMNLEDFIEKECVIYVYNKVFYRQEQIDDFEVIGPLALEKKTSESVTQFLPTIYETHLGKDVMELIDSENKQRFHDLISVFSDVKTGIAALKDGSIKLKRQKDAEAVAKKNLMNYYSEKKKRFDENLNSKDAKLNSLQNHINNFENTIAKLSKLEVIAELQEENRKYLVDYFDVVKIRNSKAMYEKNQLKIKQKFNDIKDELSQYDNQLKMMEENIPNQYDKLNSRIQDIEIIFTDIHDSNVQELRNFMEVSYNKPTKLDINEFLRAETLKVSPKLKELDHKLAIIRDEIEDFLVQNAGKLKDFITDIANLQGIIRKKIQNKMTIFETLVEKHEKDMFNFEILEKFPTVYQKSLDEILRRNSAIRVHEELLDVFEKYIDNENRLRQEFLKTFQDYLPKTFCPFFSKQFLPINFDNIRRILYDTTIQIKSLNLQKSSDNLSGSRNDSGNFLTSSQNSSQLMKLLSDATQKEKMRENEILALKQRIIKQQEELDNFSEGIKSKILNVANIRTLFGSLNYDSQFDNLADAFKRGMDERVKKLETKITQFKIKKFAPLIDTVNNLKVYKSKYEASKTLIDDLKKKCDDLEAFKMENEFLFNHQKKESESQYNLVSSLQSQLEECTSNLNALNHQCKEYENKITRLTQKIEDQRAQLESERSSYQKELDERKHSASDFENEKNRVQKELDKQIALVAYLKDQFKEKSNQLREEQELSKTMHESLTISIKQTANDAMENLRKELDLKNSEVDKLQKELNKLKSDYTSLKEYAEKLPLLETENATLRAKLDDLHTKSLDLESQVSDKTKLNQEIKEQQEINAELENKLKQLDEIPKLNDAIKELESKLVHERAKLEESENEKRKFVEEIQLLQSELHQITQSNNEIPSTYVQEVLSEMGLITLDMFRNLMGEAEYERVTKTEYEVSQLLSTVKNATTQMIRVEDFYEGCSVIAVFINGSDQEYQVINTAYFGEVKVCYIFKSEKKLGKTLIKGTLKYVQKQDTKLVEKYKNCSLIQVVLENPIPLITPMD